MEVRIISRKENPLLEREELVFIVEHDSQGEHPQGKKSETNWQQC